jgi:hypothetical protein
MLWQRLVVLSRTIGAAITTPLATVDKQQAFNLSMFSTEFRVPSPANSAPVDQDQVLNLSMFSTEFRVPSPANSAPVDRQQAFNLTAF